MPHPPETRFEILDAAPLGHCVIDDEFRVVFWNKTIAQWTEISADTVVGQKLTSRFPRLGATRFKRRLEALFAGGPPVVFSAQLHKYFVPVFGVSGDLAIQHTTVTALKGAGANGQGRPRLFLVTVQDVTDSQKQLRAYRELRKQLAATNQELIEFASIASHDLQAPVRHVAAYAQYLLRAQDSLDATQIKRIKAIESSAERMRTLIHDLLEYATVGKHNVEFADVDLQVVATAVVDNLEESVKDADAQVEIAQLPSIRGNAVLLGQLLQNMIGNALKYRRDGAAHRVRVFAERDGDHTIVAVDDNGIGFDNDCAERLFEPFRRLVGRSQFAGAGIGMATARKITAIHGGRIWASGEPGKGAVFRVRLPLAQAQRSAA